MRLLAALLLASLCIPCRGDESRERPVGMSNTVKFHIADLFQHKCNSLLYRSVLIDDLCYFAVKGNITYEYAQRYCESAIDKSTFYTKRDAGGLLALMMLKSDDFHSSTTQGATKSVLCRYENPFTCKPDERREMRGRCVTKFDGTKNFKDASQHCYERKSHLPWINNDEENSAITSIVAQYPSPSAYWIDQTMKGGGLLGSKWLAASSNPVQYFHWLVGYFPMRMRLKCFAETAVTAVSTKTPINQCVAYSKWEPALQSELRQVVCVRPTDSDFNQASLTMELTTIPTTTTTTTTTTTLPPYPKNDAPKPEWMWMIKYYYNWGRILHGFCADSAGCGQMQANGIGYDWSNGAGNLGRAITRDGMTKMHTVCSEGYKLLKPLSFAMSGSAWVHNFNGNGIFVGYVAVGRGVCGATTDMWGYSCMLSGDAMYAQNLEWNTWYKGRSWGAVAFFLW